MRLKTRHGCWWEAYKQGPTRKRLRRQRMKMMRRMTEAEFDQVPDRYWEAAVCRLRSAPELDDSDAPDVEPLI
jgi:hypothetical protein